MVVDDNDVEREVCLLRERAARRVGYCFDAVAHRDDDTGFDREIFARFGRFGEARLQPRADALQMLRGDFLHFYLVVALSRVDVIENLLAARPQIGRDARVERFGNAKDPRLDRKLEPQVVQPAPANVWRDSAVIAQGLHDLFAREQNHRAEIEVVADGAELIIDQRMIRDLDAALLAEIGVDEGRARVARHLNESLRRARAELYTASGQDQQQVIRPPRLDQ